MQPSHEPQDYDCPFCRVIAGNDDGLTTQDDIVARNDGAIAWIAARWWPNNRGHVLVVPTVHTENLYSITPESGHAVHDLVQQVAIAIRNCYGCDGISTRQHNEPAGNQDVWHLHVHVFPRYAGDQLYQSAPLPGYATGDQRRPYAELLRSALGR